jgi:peptidoglycan/xylan/chitin deacetylase (PgdA/CDA1 family)/glycosyltransferase involved in cell wall biosynthesis
VRGQNIICFSKDYFEAPTSNHHVIRHLARRNRVLWLNSISTRTPDLSSGRDLGKIIRKLGAFAQGPRRVEENLWVHTPLVLPFPHSPAARAVNGQILRATVGALRRRLDMPAFQLWTFLPNVADYLGMLGESLSVYYCVDEWSKFSYVDGAETAARERELCARADVVFAVCQPLVDRKRAQNPETYLATHGVDHESFARALEDAPLPSDLAALRPPVLGFYGTIQDWVDLDLVAHLAERHPEWSIALVGRCLVDVGRLARLSNVHLLGQKPHEALPDYCRGFAAGLIPYVIDERMEYVNPIKLREYLSAGLPVVSTPVPEVERYGHLCTVARDFAAFERGVADAIASDSPERRRARSLAMRAETWERKVAQVEERVLEVQGRKEAEARRPGACPVPTRRDGQIDGSPLRQIARLGLSAALPRRRFLVQGPPEAREVCLTFDDGPDPIGTARVLDVLREHRVKATFFVIGERAARHPELLRRMVDEGHVVGDHSFTHARPEVASSRAIAEELGRSRALHLSLLGSASDLYRPPFGKVTAAKLARLWRAGRTVVLWNVDPKDFSADSAAVIGRFFARNPLRARDIVLLHDTQPLTADALPDIIAGATRDGLRFDTLNRWI